LIAKKHEHIEGDILAVCDKEHLGKTFEEGQISFTVSIRFFGGEKVTEKELKKLFKEFASINLFGDKCVEIAEKEGLITPTSIVKICGIKHAQVYKI
jgi:hypothetical protein